MAKKQASKAEIMAGIAVVAAVGALAVSVVILVTGGGFNGRPQASQSRQDSAPLISDSPDPTAEPTEPTETPPLADEPSVSGDPSAASSPTPKSTAAAAPQNETSYAYITKWGERMDVYQDYAFDYVDWLTGEEAIVTYMQDHPEVSRVEAEEMVEEAGYIRNMNPQIRWFGPMESTVYYMPDENLVNKKVDYETFRDRMIPAIDNNETWLTFVKVTVSGDSIVKIEWAYRP